MKVHSIFNSVSGEVGGIVQGSLTTFIRLSGCNLRCSYCDTKKTWDIDNGIDLSVFQIVKRITDLECKNILITGGEPLLQQKELEDLCRILQSNDCFIQIETNGTIMPSDYLLQTIDSFVFDYKPYRYRFPYNYPFIIDENFEVQNGDWVKFVCEKREDYEEAKEIIFNLPQRHNLYLTYAMSAALPLHPETLVKWMQEDKLWDVVLNFQIHKNIFENGEIEVI